MNWLIVQIQTNGQRWKSRRDKGFFLKEYIYIYIYCIYKNLTLKLLYVSLFHVIVDTDDTATKVLDVLNREQSGRVTFMPLNRLRTKTLKYPESNDRMIPMMEVLKFDKTYTKAIEQVNYIL